MHSDQDFDAKLNQCLQNIAHVISEVFCPSNPLSACPSTLTLSKNIPGCFVMLMGSEYSAPNVCHLSFLWLPFLFLPACSGCCHRTIPSAHSCPLSSNFSAINVTYRLRASCSFFNTLAYSPAFCVS